MKKIILLIFFLIILAAVYFIGGEKEQITEKIERDYSFFKTDYLQTCTYHRGREEYCECTFDYIINKRGLEGFVFLDGFFRREFIVEIMGAELACRHLISYPNL